MIIHAELVEAAIARLRQAKLDPSRLARSIADGDRSNFVTARQRRARYAALLGESGDGQVASRSLERLIGGNDLVGISYLERGMRSARSVCRVHLHDAAGSTVGFGTGFLVAPGVLLTNHHVIGSSADASHAVAEFDYETDIAGRERPLVAFATAAERVLTDEALDFCLVRLTPRSLDGRHAIESFGWLKLDGTPGKSFVGEYLTIIQHPGGERKQVCVRENKLLRYDDNGTTLWYQTDTVGGSSGSPVFNQTWQVVALHHSGVPQTDAQGHWLTVDGRVWNAATDDESRVRWIANEGIRVSSLIAYLSARQSEPLAHAVVSAPASPLAPTSEAGRGAEGGAGPELADGELRVTIPVRVSVRVGDVVAPVSPAAPAQVAPAPAAPTAPLGSAVGGGTIESVSVDQSNYAKRAGYDPNFLGDGGLVVPLPKLSAALKSKAVSFTVGGRTSIELRYWNYSVVLHRQRRLAIFSAVNVDAEQRPDGAGREGDRWFFDTRIPESVQLGAEFYGAQKTFEADRTSNPFDKGHLTRRLDAQWGRSEATAKRNGDDSFHWSNCSPQHWKFNQGAKRWLGLEDYVVSGFAAGGKACVFNGPVFDAPRSTPGPGDQMRPNVAGKRAKDPTFGGVAIPKLFYKIVACEGEDGQLAVAAFLMSQEDFLATMDRLHGGRGAPAEVLTEAEARLYQVSVADITTLTGLDFGSLAKTDRRAPEALGFSGPRVIQKFEEIRLHPSNR